MSDCVNCGAAAQYCFHALEIHTLHIRDLSGEKRVQALGNVVEFSICKDCAKERLQKNLSRVDGKRILPFAIILLVGIAFLILLWNSERAFRLCGVSGLICGILGIACTVKESKQRHNAYHSLSEEKALEKAAWETVVSCADHKCGDHDLSYIPVTPETLKMKNGDLMVGYDLLPDTAVQAWDILHNVMEKEKTCE